MVHRKGTDKPRRLVWRITPNSPNGEYVDLDAPPPKVPANPLERPEPGWRESSFDLAHGLEVSDETDTWPGELIDEMFKKKP